MIIGVDVDLTFVRSDLGLFDWINNLTDGEKIQWDQEKMFSYYMGDHYPDVDNELILDYWRQRDLYDDMEPIPGCVETLEHWKSQGHKIVFVSQIKGDHHKSKHGMCKRYAPFMDGFVATKEKQFAGVDMLIDDRSRNLNSVEKAGIIPIMYHTNYTQDLEYNPFHTIYDWSKEKDLIKMIQEYIW